MQAEESKMTDKDNKEQKHEFLTLDSLESRVSCDRMGCDKMNPAIQCSTCCLIYYCSEECQQKDLELHQAVCRVYKLRKKIDCLPDGLIWTSILSQNMFNGTEEDLDAAIQAATERSSINTDCSICMKDPIEDTVVLDLCHHGFCTPCLLKWEAEQRSFEKWEENQGVPKNFTCPLCAQAARSVSELISYKAGMYQAKARRPNLNNIDRKQFLELAIQEINKGLSLGHLSEVISYFKKAELLVEIGRGQEALDCIDQGLRINQTRIGFPRRLMEEMARARAEQSMEQFMQIQGRLKSGFQGFFGSFQVNASAKTEIEIYRGGAYICMGDYEEAAECYESVLPLLSSPEVTPLQKKKIYEGQVKCSLYFQDYLSAIEACDTVLNDIDQQAKGFYTYRAQAHLARAEEYREEAENAVKTAQAHARGEACRGACREETENAITTMKMGLLYEAPWDKENRQKLVDFYNKLVQKQRNTKEGTT